RERGRVGYLAERPDQQGEQRAGEHHRDRDVQHALEQQRDRAAPALQPEYGLQALVLPGARVRAGHRAATRRRQVFTARVTVAIARNSTIDPAAATPSLPCSAPSL